MPCWFRILHWGVHYDYQACIWALRNYDSEVYDMEICINMIGNMVRLDHKMYLIWLKIMVKHSFPVGHSLALLRPPLLHIQLWQAAGRWSGDKEMEKFLSNNSLLPFEFMCSVELSLYHCFYILHWAINTL